MILVVAALWFACLFITHFCCCLLFFPSNTDTVYYQSGFVVRWNAAMGKIIGDENHSINQHAGPLNDFSESIIDWLASNQNNQRSNAFHSVDSVLNTDSLHFH